MLGVLACRPAAADELPLSFLGDWLPATGDGSQGGCRNNDWVLKVKPQEIEEYEAGCRFTSIKALGGESMLVKMACRGAGDPGKWRATETWRIDTAAGRRLLVRDGAENGRQVYRKCDAG